MLVTALTSVTVPARGLRLLILLTGAPFSGCPSSHRLGPVSRWIHIQPTATVLPFPPHLRRI